MKNKIHGDEYIQNQSCVSKINQQININPLLIAALKVIFLTTHNVKSSLMFDSRTEGCNKNLKVSGKASV